MRPPSGSSKKAAQSSRRIASICSGAFVLAEAGLLNGRRATMHWAHAASFRARFPDVQTEEDRIFIKDGPVWTSAGMTAGIDLVLALIDNDLGPDTAKLVARLLVMHERRLGGQKQHSALLDMTPRSDRIELVLAHIRQNLRNPLTIDELAAVANLSPRQFSRAFLAETGQSPAKAVEQLRLEAARFMLEEGRHTVSVIARNRVFPSGADAAHVRAGIRCSPRSTAETATRASRGDQELGFIQIPMTAPFRDQPHKCVVWCANLTRGTSWH
jgi:transcriptional regulator GlxA family with amidase domain